MFYKHRFHSGLRQLRKESKFDVEEMPMFDKPSDEKFESTPVKAD